jgi:excisionase family DNA binding protein
VNKGASLSDFVTVAQCAKALHLSNRTVRRLIESGLLPAEQPNPRRGRYRIRRADLEAYAAKYRIQLNRSGLESNGSAARSGLALEENKV